MAFHQPTRQLPQRVNHLESEDGDSAIVTPQIQPGVSESQTWVLFSPGTDAGTTTSYFSSIQDDQITPGRSRVSLLGSLDSVAQSDRNSQLNNSAVPSELMEESIVEDDAELDSLDSHLPDFRGVPIHCAQHQQGDSHAAPVLPGHDGLGSFGLDTQGTNVEAQDRLYAFEQFNPNRVKHTRESFDRIRMALDNEEVHEVERNSRIEAWRLEQSQLLLEDIRRETRRRQSEVSLHKNAPLRGALDSAVWMATLNDPAARDADAAGTDWHDQDGIDSAETDTGIWNRITRRVICGLMGIDDKMLAILFGEALPDEDMSSTPKASPCPMGTPANTPAVAHMESESLHDSTWQLRMLERVARELGLLVHKMSTHPGAFSTFARMQQMPLPYAGLTVIPELPTDMSELQQKADDSVPTIPPFQPTVAQPVAIPGARAFDSTTQTTPPAGDLTASNAQHTFTQQEWEQDLDIKLVFRYLRSRFSSSRPSTPPFTPGTSHVATSSAQDAAAKVARVRQHHPLISHAHGHHRSRPTERRTFKATTPSSPVALRHASGSCASQSTRRSARRGSVSSRHSSRHYWDIGGSIGTGSIVASTGPMGSWGEV